ncbi:MAG: hypothetical protein L6416_07225 [Candidatus Omnitrophica bacterium]|nr:hypothetical protein [Actinomycetota bacterium]MCG2712098.1 hypothetical protein [Candidatus Omnitrophota bacterium]
MDNISNSSDRTAKRIRWAARVIGITAGAFWVISLIASSIAEFGTPVPIEGFILAGLVAINVIGIITAWWKEKIGGIIIVTAAVALCTFSYIEAGHNKILALLISGFPFLISGILFIISWWRSKKVYSL